jgi:hypothetical protein
MKVHTLAIAAGIITDFLLSVLVAPLEQLMMLTPVMGQENAISFISSLILGLIAIIAGGAVTAHLSSSSKMSNAAIYGILEVCLGISLTFFTPAPVWFIILSILFIFPASLGGAQLAIRMSSNSK